MKKVSTQLKHFQFFYPYTVALVGARSETHINYMACAWHTALSFDPPLFGILIAKKRLTHQVISEAGEFTVNFLAAEQVRLSAQMGRISGHERDKVEEFEVKLTPSQVIASPTIAEAYVSFECQLIDTKTYGDHDLFVGQVLAVHEQEGLFSEDGVLDPRKVSPLLYLGCDFYVTLDPDTLKHVVPD